MSIHGTTTIGSGNRYLTAGANTSLNAVPGVFSRIRMFGTGAPIQGFSVYEICPGRRMTQLLRCGTPVLVGHVQEHCRVRENVTLQGESNES